MAKNGRAASRQDRGVDRAGVGPVDIVRAPWMPIASSTTRDRTVEMAARMGAEAEAEDEDRIEDRRRDAGAKRHIHGPACVADATQDAGGAHAERHDRRGGNDDPQEARRQFERLSGGAEKPDEVVQERPDCRRQRRGDQPHEHQRRAAHACGLVAVAASEAARDQRAAGDGEADGDRDREEQQRGREADGRGQFRYAEQRDVEEVDASTMKIAISPIEAVAVIATTWRMVEPVVNLAA